MKSFFCNCAKAFLLGLMFFELGQAADSFKCANDTATGSTGFTSCGIAHIDSINRADSSRSFRKAGCPCPYFLSQNKRGCCSGRVEGARKLPCYQRFTL